jgi:putative transposase
LTVRVVKRAYTYRFYPTPEQATELRRTFGCVRKVYNMALEARTTAWYQEQRRVSYVESSALLTQWKQDPDLSYLSEVSSVPMQQGLRHLQGAFTNFWQKRARYPQFKSKRNSRASAEYTRSGFTFRAGRLTLAKMTEPLAIVWSRPLPEGADPTTVTVSRDASGRWHVSMLVETTVETLAPNGATGRTAAPALVSRETLPAERSRGRKVRTRDGACRGGGSNGPCGTAGDPRDAIFTRIRVLRAAQVGL